MAGSHLAPSSSSRSNKNRSRAAEPERKPRSRAYERDYDPDYDLDYDDQDYYEEDRAPRSRGSRQYRDGYGDYHGGDDGGGGKWKTVLLVILLVVVLAAIAFLVWRLFGAQIMGLFDRGGKEAPPVAAEVAPGITTQFTAEYENGKSISGDMSITESTKRPPADLADSGDTTVVDVTWADNKAPEEPVYVTVSDPSFPNDEGLAVYSYTQDELVPDEGEWSQIGTYAIRNNSVTFRVEEPDAFALQVISAHPAPVDTPEPSDQPSPSPMPTPVATPAPVAAIDYGVYGEAQSGVFAEVDEIDDDEVYVIALVSGMPTEAGELSDEGVSDSGSEAGDITSDTGSDGSSDGGMTISYVDAGTGAETVAAPETGAAQAPAQSGPVASVLLNIDGSSMRTVDVNMFQADDGTWCLDGSALTAGMLWTSNMDYYSSGYRYSLENNDAYINLGDNSESFILNDNHIRTRFLIEDVEKDDGSTVRTLTYGDDGTHYINSMEMIPDAVTADDFPATGNASGDDVQGQVIPSGHVLYLGSGLMPESDAVARDLLQFTTSREPNDALQVMLFKLDDSIQAPAPATGAAPAVSAGHILVPAIDETTNLSLLQIKDGSTVLQNGIDYTVNARVYNDTVVVTVRFMGNYSGQIVRTYPGTKVLCNDVFAEVSPSPEPSASPSPSLLPSSTPGQTEATAAPTATPPTTVTEPGPVQPTQEPGPQQSQSTPEPPQSTPNPTQEPAPTQQPAPPSGNEGGSSGGDSNTDTEVSGGDSETDTNG